MREPRLGVVRPNQKLSLSDRLAIVRKLRERTLDFAPWTLDRNTDDANNPSLAALRLLFFGVILRFVARRCGSGLPREEAAHDAGQAIDRKHLCGAWVTHPLPQVVLASCQLRSLTFEASLLV
ncbi:MAG TPA: hypothetical protein VEW46_25795 [Pyrinomonadaceae bacterium]|nr:hypothetical protein [Pyrinomonadaceae bacterium]